MIQDILNNYFDNKMSLEDALIQLEKKRHGLEMELVFLKDFKQEKSDEIALLIKEYPEGYKGHQFEVRNGRTMYNFKGIEEWETHKKALTECEVRYKAMLNAKLKGAVHANVSEDGEELDLPTISYGKPSVLIKELKTV